MKGLVFFIFALLFSLIACNKQFEALHSALVN